MPSLASAVVETNLPLPVVNKGKVRDIYDADTSLLIVTTDRISAFDYVLPEPIPSKGICLTQLSKFWFDYTKELVPNHLLSVNTSDFPDEVSDFAEQLNHRTMMVKKAKVIPIECIVRGYISGSAWKSYQKDGTVCGQQLQSGLQESEQFNEPLFTPSTKAAEGHDINISIEHMKELVGTDIAEQLETLSLKLYNTGAEYARKRGIVIADTKFEFGTTSDGEVILIDEALTPDSSRFWPADQYEPGRSQPSFDKQYVRDYLSSTGWDKNSSPPHLPEEVINETQRKYQEAYTKITEKPFSFS